MASKFQEHKARWSTCKRCQLWRTRTRTVLVRGQLPCDVLFVGEAPGASEDVIGRPFVGPAGKLLDRMMRETLSTDWRIAITNLIACIPKVDGEKVIEPPDWAVRRCRPRLQEVVQMAQPQAIVLVGKHAAKYMVLPNGMDIECVEIIHPAAILRMDVSQQGLAYQRSVIALQDLVSDHLVPF